MKKIHIKNQKEMAEFAKKFANECEKNSIIGLKGSLGAGKSFFAREFINEISAKKTEILSPTFNLVYSYKTKKGEVSHFDLYRLKSVEELENIGFFEAIKNGICLIEWPEIAENFLKKNKNYCEISIEFDEKNEEARIIVLS